jgi:hypothetical protein
VHVRNQATGDFWDGLVDTNDADCVAVLKGYLDASTRKDSGLLSVAIYLFESGRVRRFRQKWRDTFGSNGFSWADLIAGQSPFEHVRDGNGKIIRKELDPLVEAGVSIVREYVIAGSIVSCWAQDVQKFAPTWIKGFGHAYSVAGHMAMAGMGDWAKRNGYAGGISYVIEEGDEGWDQLSHLLTYTKNPLIRDLYQWAGDSRAPKATAAPFHAPDLLAWEWGKYWQETALENKRQMRMSLVHLLIDRLDRYSFNHLAGPPMIKFFNSIHALGVEQLEEARAALSPASSIDVSDVLQSSAQTELGGDPE